MIDRGLSRTFSSLWALQKWLGRALFYFFPRVVCQLMLSSSVGSSAKGCSIDLYNVRKGRRQQTPSALEINHFIHKVMNTDAATGKTVTD